jgi:hypothetical protein
MKIVHLTWSHNYNWSSKDISYIIIVLKGKKVVRFNNLDCGVHDVIFKGKVFN